MGKIAIGINLRAGTWVKRIWFELDPESKAQFDTLCKKINDLDAGHGWKEFLQAVEMMFAANGFHRIAK